MDAPALENQTSTASVALSMPMNKNTKDFFLFLAGSLLLITGITLVLIWWEDVTALFRGGIGMVIALAGMIVLYLVKR